MKKQVEAVFFSDCEQHLLSYNQFDNFEINRESLESRILRAFETLTQREVEVLILRFGLFGHKAQTFEKIGLNACNVDSGKIGVTRTRIRQIQEKAIRKLRHPVRRHFFE